jgi:DNA-directed RNA polymerase subunit RPC12/RpoP
MFTKKTIFDFEPCPHCGKDAIEMRTLVDRVTGILECPECKGRIQFKTSIYLTIKKYPTSSNK